MIRDLEFWKTHVVIRVAKSGRSHNAFMVQTGHEAFDNEVKFRKSNDLLEISYADIDYNGKTVKPYSVGNSLYKCFQASTPLPVGTYVIDEERSDSGSIFINLKKPITE